MDSFYLKSVRLQKRKRLNGEGKGLFVWNLLVRICWAFPFICPDAVIYFSNRLFCCGIGLCPCGGAKSLARGRWLPHHTVSLLGPVATTVIFFFFFLICLLYSVFWNVALGTWLTDTYLLACVLVSLLLLLICFSPQPYLKFRCVLNSGVGIPYFIFLSINNLSSS